MCETTPAQRRYLKKQKMLQAQGGKCFICGEPIYEDQELTFDHLIPKILFLQFGFHQHAPNNGVVAHKHCNSRKGHSFPKIKTIVRASKIHGYDVKANLKRYFIFKHKFLPYANFAVSKEMLHEK